MDAYEASHSHMFAQIFSLNLLLMKEQTEPDILKLITRDYESHL